jgi:outer membrane lipoprotein-sorting protein
LILVERRAVVALVHSLTLLFLAAVALGLFGCATVAPPLEPKPPVPQWEAGKLIESVTQRDKQVRSMRALAQVDYAGPEGKHGFQEAVLVQRPDRLRLETLTFLGAILIVTANNKEIVGYHPREGVFVRGGRTKDNLRRYTQIPLELEEITSLLIGLPPVDVSAPPKQESNTLVFSPNGRKRDVLTFESTQPVPTKWERFNADEKVELTARFSDYVSTSAGLFPLRIVFEAVLQKKKVEIRYQQPELNAAIPADLFSQQKPANAQEVPIEAIGS